MPRATDFIAAIEAAIFDRDDAPTNELVHQANRLTESDCKEIGDVFARRLAANDVFGVEHALFNFSHSDTLPAICDAALRVVEANRRKHTVIRLLAFQAPAILDPHREWLAQRDVNVMSERDEAVTPAVGSALHIVTPPGCAEFRAGVPTPTWLASYGHLAGTARCGGSLEPRCGTCGHPLHLLLELANIPPQIRLSVERITIASCLACLNEHGGEGEELWFRHHLDGSVSALVDRGEGAYYDSSFPSGPLAPTTAELVDFAARYARQSWGVSNGFENLNRLGGAPSWVQDEQVVDCCERRAPMRHLLQLDSRFPRTNGESRFFFGSGGIGYVQWCDACRLSAQFWQCT